jgi:pimeloyl-ACP methyl ester carboxylesterase
VTALERSELHARTGDGVRLSIQRLAPEGPRRGAVVLQHGLGSNGLAFLVPGFSLAEHLAGLGYDCFVPDLRGSGRSERPRGSYSLDDYVEYDVPTVLEAALGASGQSQVHWIGHSMGGILMWMYGIENPHAPVSSMVSVASALDYRPGKSVYRQLARLLPFFGFLRSLPFDRLAQLNALVAGMGPLFMPEGMNFFRPNIERAVCRQVMTRGFTPIPLKLFTSLATTFSSAGFSRKRGAIAYLALASAFTRPTLLIGGSRDPQVSPEAIAATAELLSGVGKKRVAMFGRAHGHGEDYGHFDLLIGKRAASEVWPHIVGFLDAADSKVAAASVMIAE